MPEATGREAAPVKMLGSAEVVVGSGTTVVEPVLLGSGETTGTIDFVVTGATAVVAIDDHSLHWLEVAGSTGETGTTGEMVATGLEAGAHSLHWLWELVVTGWTGMVDVVVHSFHCVSEVVATGNTGADGVVVHTTDLVSEVVETGWTGIVEVALHSPHCIAVLVVIGLTVEDTLGVVVVHTCH